MHRVFVLSSTLQPLMPCHPARARALLSAGRAKVYRRVPFTVILTARAEGETQPLAEQLDPGSKTTGLALVALFQRGRRVLWAGELSHRGQAIKSGLDSRRALRRGRRHRKTRYRAPRFDNRRRPPGWLPPSIQSRVDNCAAWDAKLRRLAPISSIAVETVRFDTQLLEHPDIAGVEYQQGTLLGCELREYLLARHHHTCAYCLGQSKDPILEREHVVPRCRGGSDRVANAVLACRTCNAAKANLLPAVWIEQLRRSKKPIDATRARQMEKILTGWRPSLRDAAAMNATRYAIGRALKTSGLPVSFSSGGRTRFNRTHQGYPKAHWIDAACVGEAGGAVRLDSAAKPLQIQAVGRGSRQMTRPDRYGFPRTGAKRVKRVLGLQTGDWVRLRQPSGKYAGTYVGRVAVRERGAFDIQVVGDGQKLKITAPAARFTLLQRGDGYAYTT